MKKSKLAKVLTVSLAALMVFGLASCGGGSGKVSDKDITVIWKAPEQEMRLQS